METVLFRDVFSPFLSRTSTKVMIFLAFAGYVAVSVAGIWQLVPGLEITKLVSDYSGLHDYFAVEDRLFRDHPYRLQVVIAEPLDYHEPAVQDQVFGLLHRLEELPWVSNNSEFRQSWLHVFLAEARDNFLLLNITTRAQFRSGLGVFLAQARRHPVSRDVVLSEEGVAASRFFLQTDRLEDSREETLAMARLREVVDAAPFRALVYNPRFPFWDQVVDVLPQTVRTVLLSIFMMTVVTLVLIPNRKSVVWVIFTIFSVELGVVGFMAHWGVNLDVISMIVLIMGIGFSVDSSAHISYHYLSADPRLPPATRLAACMAAIGPPVVQGAVTTLLGIMPLLLQPSYIVRTFAKVVFLVILLGLLHSLLLLPTLLTLLGPGSCGQSGEPEEPEEEQETGRCAACEGEDVAREAAAYCQECAESYCRSCLAAHARFPVTRRHTLRGAASPRTYRVSGALPGLQPAAGRLLEQMQLPCKFCRQLVSIRLMKTHHESGECPGWAEADLGPRRRRPRSGHQQEGEAAAGGISNPAFVAEFPTELAFQPSEDEAVQELRGRSGSGVRARSSSS